MADTIGLVGDGDDVDIVYDVERAFGVKLTDEEARRTRTVGQLHDHIERKIVSSAVSRACLSQAAFYRLRRALREMGIDARIAPQTPLSLLNGIPPKSLAKKWRLLARKADLKLPRLETEFRGWRSEALSWIITLITFVLGLHMSVGVWHQLTTLSVAWMIIPVIFGAVAMSIGIDHVLALRRLPRRLATVGDLAREAEGCSFTKLAAEKNGCSPSDRWFALTAILRETSGHEGSISAGTTLFAQDVKSAP
jgi:hypothetical protein